MAVDNGFDREVGAWLAFASTQTSLRVWLTAANDTLFQAALSQQHVAAGLAEASRPIDTPLPDGAVAGCAVAGIPEMHRLVRRAFQLSRTLSDALLHRFEQQVSALPFATEAERLIVQRIGQDVSSSAPATSGRGPLVPATPNGSMSSMGFCWRQTWMRPSTVASSASLTTATCWCRSY